MDFTPYDVAFYGWFIVAWMVIIGGMGSIAPLFEWGCYLAIANLIFSILFVR